MRTTAKLIAARNLPLRSSRMLWRLTSLAFALMLATGILCSPAFADTLTIGTNTGSNAYPFTDPVYAGEYQQVYSGAAFSGPELITAISFFPGTPFPGSTITGDFIIDLSTTSAGVGTLSTTYANNIGANSSLFFSGSVSGVLTFTGTPFLYDPSMGNLLMDVEVVTPDSSIQPLAGGCSADTDRVFNLGGSGVPTTGNPLACTSSPTSYGLETEFTMTPAVTPEPSSLLLLGLALFGLVIARGKLRLGDFLGFEGK